MIQTKSIQIGDFSFTCRVAGDETDELVVFLHGFPQASIMWEKVMTEVASLGFYCLAPDMRGYSANARPRGRKNYATNLLTQDILNLVAAENKEHFHLVAHDMGAVVGWTIAFFNSDKVISMTALSVPHNHAFGKAYQIDPDQKKKSRYIGFFLLPFLPELVLRWNNFSRFRALWSSSTSTEANYYLSLFKEPYALTATLNYYRANIGKGKGQSIGKITVPTLLIWGNQDMAVSKFAAEVNAEYMEGAYSFLELDAGHWLIETQYPVVKKALVEHIMKYKS